ncbi:MAG: S41 family peptidase [Pseudomonadota bacterium]
MRVSLQSKALSVAAAFAMLSAFSISSAEPPEDRRLSPDQIARDIALAQEVYTRIHPGYTRYTSATDLNAAWQSVQDGATETDGLSVGAFYVEASRVLAEIRCDHTKAELPSDLAETRKTQPIYLPLRWEMIEGRGFVSVAAADIGLQRGDEILAIDGDPLEARADAIRPLIPFDGETAWVRDGQIAQSYEFRGGGLDHFGALMFETGATAELTIQRGDAAPMAVMVDRITHPEWRALGAGQVGARNFKDAIRFKRIGGTAAYLAVDTFVNYRTPVDPASLYDPIFASLQAEGRDTLIVDLRRNGGGSDDAALGLVARLIGSPAPFMRDIRVKTLDLSGLEEYIYTWDSSAMSPDPRGFKANENGTYSILKPLSRSLMTLTPRDTAFQGQLILLTSRNNASGSTHLLSFIKAQNPDAILIGEATGGSAEGATAGILFTLTLPESGIKMRVPAMQSFVNNGGFETGLGMSPDIEAPITVEAFLEAEDPAMQAALTLISAPEGFSMATLK